MDYFTIFLPHREVVQFFPLFTYLLFLKTGLLYGKNWKAVFAQKVAKNGKNQPVAVYRDLSIKDTPPITDVSIALDRMFSVLTKRKKKVLVTIDETSSTQNMREFAAQFQIYLRKNYNVFILMTGLFENVNALQNEKSLTGYLRFSMELWKNFLISSKWLILRVFGELQTE